MDCICAGIGTDVCGFKARLLFCRLLCWHEISGTWQYPLSNGAAGEYLFPVQLAETILFLLAFLLLHRMAERKRNGIIPKSLLLYAILKFVLDYLRYYEDRKIFSANQWGCLLVAVSVLLYEAVRQIKQRANNKVI